MGSLPNNPTLPVINFSEENLSHGSDSWLSTSKDVVRALETYGCFIATYSRFSMDMHEAIYCASKELLDLPTNIKVLNVSETPTHGYVGQVAVIPLYEGLGIENATTVEGVDKFTNLMWRSGNRSFSETALAYTRLVAELDQVVMRMVSENYGITESYESLHDATSYLLKLIKYRVPKENETKQGIIPHTDKSFMSLLHQCQVKGLEVKTKDGEWIIVDPSPSTFVVMAGDVCMAWTNGRIEPSQHRVIMRGNEERYSLGVFTFVRDLEIKVPEELIDDDEHPLMFKPFYHYKFLHYHSSEQGKRSKCPIKDYCGVQTVEVICVF